MGKKIDLTNKIFGNLLVLKEEGKNKRGILWRVVCNCGNEKVVNGVELRRKDTKSCGCLRRKQSRKNGKNSSKKISGEKCYAWKENNVGYGALHKWIRKTKSKSGICSLCKKKRYTEFANISGLYRRDINDYIELCCPCHKKRDWRIKKLNKLLEEYWKGMVKMPNKKWTKKWPNEIGYFWFYGYRFGKICCGIKCEPELMLVKVNKCATDLMYVADGQFLFKSEVEEAHFQKAIIPELPIIN